MGWGEGGEGVCGSPASYMHANIWAWTEDETKQKNLEYIRRLVPMHGYTQTDKQTGRGTCIHRRIYTL